MARRGAWQLKELAVTYCDWGGSSKGAREFVASWLPLFQQENPQLSVTTAVQRGSHPYLTAQYQNNSARHVDLKNQEPEEILRQSIILRSSAGRKTANRVKKRQISSQPTAQGVWKANLDLGGSLKWLNGKPGAGSDAASPAEPQ